MKNINILYSFREIVWYEISDGGMENGNKNVTLILVQIIIRSKWPTQIKLVINIK